MSVLKRIAILQAYIYHRKGKHVEIQVPSNIIDMSLLVKLSNYAIRWFEENEGSYRMVK